MKLPNDMVKELDSVVLTTDLPEHGLSAGDIGTVVLGRFGWRARYLKEVNADETTVRFWQEIYDDTGRLVEIHEKFPVDKGHQKV